ncbi:MAG: alpha-L-arabinofuranosidase C-terminal domain-containing protein [Christensenellales bacterium]|jgi:alpha-N-arabinofuranosidase
MKIHIEPERLLAERDIMIYGHFLEHFHRQIYGGVFDPGNPLSDGDGFRTDVLDALRKIRVPVIRWPGGCFVSSYDWKEGVGLDRRPVFDKAWRVEEPNTFGTDEFALLCEKIGARMYICSNAGTGTAEQMSDWLEYTNLNIGKYARLRKENGHAAPYGVRYFSIGNENYGAWEIGAKERREWARLVAESAKMLKRVDPGVQLSAAALPDPEWTMELLRHAGKYLDWVSIHAYWDGIQATNDHATYEQAMAYTDGLDTSVRRTEGLLAAMGLEEKIRIAFDEWNLQGWYHPGIHTDIPEIDEDKWLAPRDKNDDNSQYTMADAVFTGCVLNMFLRHANSVRMANFAPTVNTRGMIYTHKDGIVLRGAYHVFDIYVNRMGAKVIDSWSPDALTMDCADKRGDLKTVPVIDSVATLRDDGKVALSLVNKHASDPVKVTLSGCGRTGVLYTVSGDSVLAYNDIDAPGRVKVTGERLDITLPVSLPPHSVSVLVCGS